MDNVTLPGNGWGTVAFSDAYRFKFGRNRRRIQPIHRCSRFSIGHLEGDVAGLWDGLARQAFGLVDRRAAIVDLVGTDAVHDQAMLGPFYLHPLAIEGVQGHNGNELRRQILKPSREAAVTKTILFRRHPESQGLMQRTNPCGRFNARLHRR